MNLLTRSTDIDPRIFFTKYNAEGLYIPHFKGHVPMESNISRLYQDDKALADADADSDPLGLVLDESQGAALGAELNDEGDFLTPGNWSTTKCDITVDGDELVLTATDTGVCFADLIISHDGGRWSKLECEISSPNGRNAYVAIGNGTEYTSPAVTSSSFTARQIIADRGAVSNITLRVRCDCSVIGQTARFRSVSIKHVFGNHAYQSTDASRLTLVNDAGPESDRWAAQGDGTADHLVTGLVPGAATTMIVAVEAKAASDYLFGANEASSNYCTVGVNGSGFPIFDAGSGNLAGNTSIVDVPGVLAARFDGVTASIFWRAFGGSISKVAEEAQSGTPTTTIPIMIGARNNNGSASTFADADFLAAFIIQAALTDAEIAALANHMIRTAGR